MCSCLVSTIHPPTHNNWLIYSHRYNSSHMSTAYQSTPQQPATKRPAQMPSVLFGICCLSAALAIACELNVVMISPLLVDNCARALRIRGNHLLPLCEI